MIDTADALAAVGNGYRANTRGDEFHAYIDAPRTLNPAPDVVL